jgi:hypothetical protein
MLIVYGVPLRDARELIREFCQFALERFVKPSVIANANIRIRIIDRNDLPEDEREEMAEAGAWMTYDGKLNGKKLFTVKIDNKSVNKLTENTLTAYKTVLKLLAHEMVHVKQYLTNQLFDYSNGTHSRFEGKLYSLPTSKTMDWEYFNSPWEIEAYGLSEGLYYMYLQKVESLWK